MLADGDIHVYGLLSGRVIAGLASSDSISAKIFIRQFRPSLIGIGASFIIPDDHAELRRFKDKSVIISLVSEDSAGGGGSGNANGLSLDSSSVKIGFDDGNFLVFTPLQSF